jgi:hypothetical protein
MSLQRLKEAAEKQKLSYLLLLKLKSTYVTATASGQNTLLRIIKI